jgi:hypothetical protein
MLIDMVYTYVNGRDPTWLNIQQSYTTEDNNNSNTIYEKTNNIRYLDINEINYSIQCCLRFAPFINKIYIITDNQIPPISGSLIEEGKVIIINHTEIIPANILPVYFSDVIESYMHNIPNLSELFIYNNDDFFFFDNITENDIYNIDTSGKIKCKIINTFDINVVKNYSSGYAKRLVNTSKILNTIGIENKNLINNHCSKILRKSTMKYIETEYAELLKTFRTHRFRNDITIQYLFLVLNIDNMLNANIIVNNPDKKLYTIYDFAHNCDNSQNTIKKFTFKKCKFVCYNNMNSTYVDIFSKLMKQVLK